MQLDRETGNQSTIFQVSDMRELRITNQITSRNQDSLNRYLNEIAKFPLLDIQEEIRLAKMVKEGDKEAERKLIKANLRFVVSCAKKYQCLGASLADLVNDGNMGLMRAASLYDESKGFKFISYAVWWIRHSMLTAVNEHMRSIRIPMNQVHNLKTIKDARDRLEAKIERTVSLSEIAEETGLQEDLIMEIEKLAYGTKLLDDLLLGKSDAAHSLIDSIPSVEIDPTVSWYTEESLGIELKRVLKKLTDREQFIITHFYGLFGITEIGLSEIGSRLNITAERVRQLLQIAIVTLKQNGVESLREYV
ncbi:RNA polymerase sigma factor RpoD/SigA [Pedobacter psychrodurus]|uniref:RNA polymerase sigma factor RpoD/SigA n=1 Tax=Pedobacter psychrodurus TaxID=2530456 RepID=A0A4R0PZC7_9SPHI|nr:RNA polymerase sigma factor RpoD/SigA [Pedobacter psychrodurus]TCD28591.1 RNA polymerase sigma factor RpoD/SigA [Pedobacter psychrodurus]